MTDKKVKITVEAKDKTAAELAKTRGEMDKTGATAKKVNKILAAKELLGVKPYKGVQREIKQLQAAYNRLKKDGSTSAADLYQAQIRLKDKTAELKKETGDWAGQMGKAKAGLVGLAGAGYLFVKSFQEYSQFSQRMAEVNTLIDVSQEKFAALGTSIRGLTKEIPQTASELASAEYDIISAGVAVEKSVGVLEQSAKAAVAGVTDTKTAANIGIAVVNAYGQSIDKLGEDYDILFKTVKLGVTTFPELAQSMGDVLPTAKAANVGIRDVSASIATLTKAGIQTPRAVTALKGAINALAAPTPEAKKQFDALGITWKGLIPTLDAIRKKGLSIKELRVLIPDVEARTGVLALTQNFDNLVKTLGEMQDASGAMEDAYDKMKNTPENQMKLFGNVINDITISAGVLAAKGLLPLAKAVRVVIESLRDADPVTKALVLSLAAGAAGFTVWKLGLGSMVLGLKGFIVQAKGAQIVAGGLTSQFSAAGIAMKAAFAGAVIYTGYQLVQLTKTIYGWRQAVNEAKKSQQNLVDNSDRLIRKYAEFKDIKLPDNITDLAQQDLDDLRKKLEKARAYYTALRAKLAEKGDSKGLKDVNDRLIEINDDFKKLKEAASDASEEMKKPADAISATKDQLDVFEKQAKKAYDAATKYAADYAKQVIGWEDKIKYARLSTEDQIRELERKGMTDAQKWADERLQAEQKLSAAREALAKGDYKLAEKLANDSKQLYAGLATEVKNNQNGKDVVVKSLQDTKQVAINGVQEVGNFIQDLYTKQKDAAQKAHDEWQATADGIKKQLDEIAKEREANVNITLKGLNQAESAINKLIQPGHKDIYVTVHQQQAKRFGGPVYASIGKKLAGYGGGDIIDAKLEPGEFVVRKEAVRKYGAGLFEALNAMRVDAHEALRRRIGGMIANTSVSVPRHAYQTGGPVAGTQGGNEVFTLRLQAGNVDLPINAVGNRQTMRGMIKDFEKELIRLGMVKR